MENPRLDKTMIISGANGYFGEIACQYFKSERWKVLQATRQPKADIFIDLDRPEELASQRLTEGVNLFIHAAAAHEVTCREQPYRSVMRNVAGTKAALDFCIANEIPNFVYLSTFHVFGSPSGLIDESTPPFPANDYGLSHLQAEEYVQMYARQHKINGLVVRPSNFFGMPANLKSCKRWTLTPLAFCKEAIENGKIVLQTPGFQRRNFVSALDICAAIATATAQIEELPLLHISGPETLSIRELAQLVQQVAQTYLDKEIKLFMPDGKPIQDSFVYTSRHLSSIYQPSHQIKPFIIELCKRLQFELSAAT